MTKYANNIGVRVPELLLPNKDVDMTKWAVVACDQFTSQPDYWNETEKIVGDAPSTLRIMLPELYLDKPDEDVYKRQISCSLFMDLTSRKSTKAIIIKFSTEVMNAP